MSNISERLIEEEVTRSFAEVGIPFVIGLGLDFENSALGIRLAEGDYLAAQIPSANPINWDEWIFDPNSGSIVNRDDRSESLPYNYIVFRVSRYREAAPR